MQYDLVFEGGGAKGMVFVGAMQAFEARGHTFKRLLGTSAGAITACLLAAGYTSQEMLAALAEVKNGQSVFAGFMAIPDGISLDVVRASLVHQMVQSAKLPFVNKMDGVIAASLTSLPELRCIFSFVEMGGWYSADNFLAWLKTRLDTGTNKGKPRQYSGLTLAQFFDQTGIDFSVVASDTTGAEMLVLNHRTAPNVPLPWAVRMSMSIPLLWQAVVWQPEWGKYLNEEKTGHEIVDGGLLSNFPIELFVSKDPDVKGLMGPETASHVLGMLIDESMDVPGLEIQAVAQSGFNLATSRPAQRLANLLNTATTAHDKMVVDGFQQLVAHMPAKGYGTTEFNMSDQKRQLLVQAGNQAMNAYFQKLAQQPSGNLGMGMAVDPVAARAQQGADKFARKVLHR